MRSWKNNAVRWLRVVHRDLGFLMVGISLVYGISGMLLNHMNGRDPAYRSSYHTLQFPAGLNREGLAAAWNDVDGLPRLKTAMPIDTTLTRLMLDGGIGVYDGGTGTLDYEVHKKNLLVYWINKLHYNQVNGWSVMGDLFAVSLIFFALSGLFMVRGRKGVGGRGKWLLLVGVLVPVCYVIFA